MAKGPRNLKVRKGSVLTEIKNTSVIDFTDISDEEMNKMIDGTLTDFDEGDLVDGTVVKIERDEVLVDIGFKSEGVIPVRELSIRKDADEIRDCQPWRQDREALVLQKEDKDGRPDPLQEACRVRGAPGSASKRSSRPARRSLARSSKSSRAASSLTSAFAAFCPHPSWTFAA